LILRFSPRQKLERQLGKLYQKTSLRLVIMKALRRDGFAIKEADMIDANLRTRGRAQWKPEIDGFELPLIEDQSDGDEDGAIAA
jgi:hypothetical protein